MANFSYSQEQKDIRYVDEIEVHLLNKQNNSVKILLSKVSKTPYILSLTRIVNNDNPTYNDYYKLIMNLSNNYQIKFINISEFINETLKEPENTDKINLDYINIKWFQVSLLRDEDSIEEASRVNEELENYVNQFNPEDTDVIKTKILLSTHQIVLYQIQKNIIKGKDLCLTGINKAKKYNDERLQIVLLNHLADYLLLERNLNEYIKVSEQSYELEKKRTINTIYFRDNVSNLIDAYIYKGGNHEKVNELLSVLYNDKKSKPLSYSLYAKYLIVLDENSIEFKNILEKFEVTSLIEFCDEIELLGENSLNPNEYFHVFNESANALESKGYLKEALDSRKKCVLYIKDIYTNELAVSLSNFNVRQKVKEKELEIKHEKEQKKLYLIISSLVIGLLLVSVFLIFRIKKQSKVLEHKNNQINKTLKEKELLVREVHHRVKNNFQIVASLLELQSKGIEDEKALALANEGKNRVKSMALIHQKLYQTDDGLINFDEYIVLLIKEISALFASDKNIETTIVSENMLFDVDTAIPLGLIVNELITNAYKYAFTENDKQHTLDISITKEEEFFKLVVSDNGNGLTETIDVKKIKSLGLRLVSRLTRQLHGKFEIKSQDGATVTILFKDARSRKEID